MDSPGLAICQGLPSGVIKHGWLEYASFMDDFPIETSIYSGFSIAMFDYQRLVIELVDCHPLERSSPGSHASFKSRWCPPSYKSVCKPFENNP